MLEQASEQRWTVDVGDFGTTTAVYERSHSDASHRVIVLAHGSSGSLDFHTTVDLKQTFLARGFGVVRFNFLYTEHKSGPPDRMPKLIACFSAVVDRVRHEVTPKGLYIGGHSMGGRAASVMTSEGFVTDGVILLAYPLHPAGQPEKLRDSHLASIERPVLCMNGTRDDLCTRALMDPVVARLRSNWTMHWLEGADHGFHVLKRSGRTEEDVYTEIGDTALAWADGDAWIT